MSFSKSCFQQAQILFLKFRIAPAPVALQFYALQDPRLDTQFLHRVNETLKGSAISCRMPLLFFAVNPMRLVSLSYRHNALRL
jgi:hypothetical protein